MHLSNRHKKNIVACGVMLAAVWCLFLYVETGGFARQVLTGEPGELNPRLPFERAHYKWAGLAGIVAGMFFWLDLHSLTAKRQQWYGRSPAYFPTDYSLMRLRRYMLIPLGMLFAGLAVRWLFGPVSSPEDIRWWRNWSIFYFAVLFFESRRPINSVHADSFAAVMEAGGEAAKGFSGQHHR